MVFETISNIVRKGSKSDDDSSLTDLYFSQVGCFQDDLEDQLEAQLQQETSSTGTSSGMLLTKQNAYSTPFHSYFQQVEQEAAAAAAAATTTNDSLKYRYSPANNSSYAMITIPQPNWQTGGEGEEDDDDDDVSTLGEGSFIKSAKYYNNATSSPRDQPPQVPLPSSIPARKSAPRGHRSRTAAVPAAAAAAAVAPPKDCRDPSKHKHKQRPTTTTTTIELKKTSTQSSTDGSDNPNHQRQQHDDDDDDYKTRWKIIYFIIAVALFLLIVSSTVLGIGISELFKRSKEEEDTTSNSNTWPSSRPLGGGPFFTPQEPSNNNNNTTTTTTIPGPDEEDATTSSTTGNPTTAPLLDASQDLLRIVTLVSPDSLQALGQPLSPQYQAFEWLVQDPEYFGYSIETLLQRWVLAIFYYSTLGPSWNTTTTATTAATATTATATVSTQRSSHTNSWLDYNTSECLWFSTAHPTTEEDSSSSSSCNENNTLLALHLDSIGIQGTLPIELSLLSSGLEHIHLSSNRLSGTIPFEYGQLTKLQRLQLTHNQLTGSIPSEVSQMSRLVVLGLGRNRLTGTIPSQLFTNNPLPLLKTLGLEGNQLQGTIPTVGVSQMTALKELALESNRFYGTIPPQLADLSSSLQTLTLHRNQLTGIMPLCPSTTSESSEGIILTTLTADCPEEVQCECCTACCMGCQKDNHELGTLVETATTSSRVPSQTSSWLPSDAPSVVPSIQPTMVPSPNPTPAPTYWWKPLLAFLNHQETPAPTTVLPTVQPPSSSPCTTPQLSTDKSCYIKDQDDSISVEFQTCDYNMRDDDDDADYWIGLFDATQMGGIQQQPMVWTKETAETWVKTCGTPFCVHETTQRKKGNITLGGENGDWPLQAGLYRIFLIRDNVPQAMTGEIVVDKEECADGA